MLPDFGWTELLVIAIVLIVVVGPKDLPRVVRGFSKSLGSMRKMAGDFRKQFDDALADAELDDLKTLTDDVRSMDPRNQIKEALNPLGEIGKDINDELKGVAKSIEEDTAPVKREITPQEAYPQLAKTADKAKAGGSKAKAGRTKAATAKVSAAKKAPAKKASSSKTATKAAAPTANRAKATAKKPAKAAAANAANTKTPTSKPAATRKKTPSTRSKTTQARKAPTAKKPAVSKAGDA